MDRYVLQPKDFDLELTMTCGQTFCWHRIDGELYGDGAPEFYTFRDGEPIIVREDGNQLVIETTLAEDAAVEALGLHHDLEDVFDEFPADDAIDTAKDEYWGLRVIQDEFFPCLISYLCSPQMQIPRIKQMHDGIARKYGEVYEVDGRELLRFPTPEELSEATEDGLRELGVGYRAKYIVETVKMIRDGFDHHDLDDMEYEEAREKMKELYGVGDKVADCVLLFSKGFYEACPLDTWAKKALKAHYEELHHEKYDEASRNMREHFGEYAGYAQEYIFHAARQGVIES